MDAAAARLLFVLWLDGGNVNPFLRLAAELVGRGHHVDVLGPAALQPLFEQQGARYTTSSDWMPSADELLRCVGATMPDVLVVDFMANETLAGAEATGLPTVALVHTLLEANRVGDDLGPMWMLGPADATNATRSRLGLAPAKSHSDLLAFAETLLVAAPELLEPEGQGDARAIHAGPMYVEGAWGGTAEVPAGEAPLVVGCAGTAATDPAMELDLLQRIVDAIASLEYRGLVSVPGYLDRSRLTEPDGVALVDYVDHPAVLPHADALVTHAGLGSVCAALVARTPMVCLPLGREQPTNAAAVARTEVGAALAPEASVDEIATAIDRVIGMPMPEISVDPTVAVRAVEALLAR